MTSLHRILATGLIAAGALGAAATAQARNDVFWSVGVGAPGVSVGIGNAPAYYPPQPVYAAPQPVYMAPQPVYVAPQPVYVRPRPVYVAPPQVYYAPVPRPIYYAPPAPLQRPYYGPGWRGQRHGERHHGYGYRD